MMSDLERWLPLGYRWMIKRGLVGFDAFSALQPWYFLQTEDIFDVSLRWPSSSDFSPLIAFARRQDCDDIACVAVKNASCVGVCVIHGWTPAGYDIDAQYADYWEWVKSVIDDVAECCERSR